MSFLVQSQSKRMLAVHGWSGTIVGIFLYICIFTGAIVVFEREIDIWSMGAVETEVGLPSRVDHNFRVYSRDVDPELLEEVVISRALDGNISYRFTGHIRHPDTGQITDYMRLVNVDQDTNEVVSESEGFIGELDFGRAELSRFWVDVHEELYIPNPWGRYITGLLGLFMMFAAISGILLHKHLIQDAFLAVRKNSRLLAARDLHILAGTWSLPFAILLAFTGAFFSFATTLGIPVMAMLAFDGDQEALIAAVLPPPAAVDFTPASIASLDYIMKDALARTDGGYVQSIMILNHNTVSAEVQVRIAAAATDLNGTTLAYDGVSRTFEGIIPIFGQEASLGAALFSLLGPLHFGDFAGLASKSVWLGLGLAAAWVTATGMLLWTERRKEDRLWRRFNNWILLTVWGLPFAMMVSATAFFVTLPAGDPGFWVPWSFALAIPVAVYLARDPDHTQARLRLANAVLAISLPILRHLMGGASWSEALMSGAFAVIVVDAMLIIAGLIMLRKWRRDTAKDVTAPAANVQEPAE